MNETIAYTPPAKKARVEIIPLIDVVFFLLATFVLFTLTLQKLACLPLALPMAGEINRIDTTIYLQVSEDGTFLWKQGRESTFEPLIREEVRGRIAAAVSTGAKPRVMVIGAGNVSYGAIVGVLDELRHLGVEQLTIETVSGR